MAFTLECVRGNEPGRRWVFDLPEVTLGRNVENHIVLGDGGVSRNHLVIIESEAGYLLRDLGSSNGTTLNKSEVQEAPLRTGDLVELGSHVLRFTLGGDPSEIQSRPDQGQRRPLGRHDFAMSDEPTNVGRPAPRPRPRPAGRPAPRPAPQAQQPAARGGNRPAPRPAPRPAAQIGNRPAPRPAPAPRQSAQMPAPDGEFSTNIDEVAAVPDAAPAGGGNKVKELISNLSRQQLIIIGVVAVLLVAGGVIAAMSGDNPVVKRLKDQSEKNIPITNVVEGQTFGHGNVDVPCYDRANFSFNYGGGRAVLEYAAGGIDAADELIVKLNGIQIAMAPLAIGRWVPNLNVELPRQHLREGTNVVTFDSTRNPPGDENWGIGDVRIKEDPLPKPDPVKAEQSFELAKSRHEARDVAWQNRYEALKLFREARDFVELMDDRPDFYYEAVDAIKTLEGELQEQYDRMIFDSRRSLQYRRKDAAIATLRNLLLMFPNPDDPRHQEVKENLGRLGVE